MTVGREHFFRIFSSFFLYTILSRVHEQPGEDNQDLCHWAEIIGPIPESRKFFQQIPEPGKFFLTIMEIEGGTRLYFRGAGCISEGQGVFPRG